MAPGTHFTRAPKGEYKIRPYIWVARTLVRVSLQTNRGSVVKPGQMSGPPHLEIDENRSFPTAELRGTTTHTGLKTRGTTMV